MDRFIADIETKTSNHTKGLKSNMDRFIAFNFKVNSSIRKV